MPVLESHCGFNTYVDPVTGQYRVFWQIAELDMVIPYKFSTYKTLPELELFFADMFKSDLFEGIDRLDCEIETNVPLIINVVKHIRTHPGLTLSQYNSYVNALEWYDEYTIRAFMFKLAIKLAEHHGVILSNYTESEVLLKTRNWICTVPLWKLKRVVFGYLLNLE